MVSLKMPPLKHISMGPLRPRQTRLSARTVRQPQSVVLLTTAGRKESPLKRPSHPVRKPSPSSRRWKSGPSRKPDLEPEKPASKQELVAHALAANESSDLVAPVRIPNDAGGVLDKSHPAMSLLDNSAIVIQRQIEMMNVFIGFEQANRYVIMNGRGETIGYLAEQDLGVGQTVKRQMLRTHRSFTAHVFDVNEQEVLRIHRPFAFISSRIRIYDPTSGQDISADTNIRPSTASDSPQRTTSSLPLDQMRILGECQQQWNLTKRIYNLFSYRNATVPVSESSAPDAAIEFSMSQFAAINEPMLSWDFTLRTSSSVPIGSVNRSFSGLARELFTDTGVYALRMDSVASSDTVSAAAANTELLPREQDGLTLDQRAVMLATAVSIDFDYFSRHSGPGGVGFMPIWIPGMGGTAAEGAGAAGAAGAAGEVGGAAAGTVGRGAAGAAAEAGTAGMAGAGTMAGYEAMQRGAGRGDQQQQQGMDDGSPVNSQVGQGDQDLGQWQQSEGGMGEDAWGTGNDPFESMPEIPSGGGEGGGFFAAIAAFIASIFFD